MLLIGVTDATGDKSSIPRWKKANFGTVVKVIVGISLQEINANL